MADTAYTLDEIAGLLEARVRGDGSTVITGLATLKSAQPGQLAFLANPRYASDLNTTKASAVIISPDMAGQAPGHALVLDNPYLGYARASRLFDPLPRPAPGVHASAVIDSSASIAATAAIGPNAVIAANVVVGDNVVIGANVVIGEDCRIGAGSRLHANCSLAHGVILGERCTILSGAVIGSDGFGFANEKGVWHRIAQLGGVVLGNDVEIGANASIDRGALDDTVIGDGVKIDNLVQIAHNVHIGDHTAIAALSGISGSSRIGRHCIFGGETGIAGHLTITDGVHLTGMTMVTRDISEPGVYSSGTGADTNRRWKKNAVRFRQLDDMARRIRELEKKTQG